MRNCEKTRDEMVKDVNGQILRDGVGEEEVGRVEYFENYGTELVSLKV